MTAFGYEIEIPVRYRDLDTYGHVNNANYATYLEEARIAYFEDVLDLEQQARGMVIASMSIDFREPIEADEVTVGLGVTRIGESSFDFEYEIEAGGQVVAAAESVQVAYDQEHAQTIRFPDEWREAVQDFEDGQVLMSAEKTD